MIGGGKDPFDACKGLSGADARYCKWLLDQCHDQKLAQEKTPSTQADQYRLVTCTGDVLTFPSYDVCTGAVQLFASRSNKCPQVWGAEPITFENVQKLAKGKAMVIVADPRADDLSKIVRFWSRFYSDHRFFLVDITDLGAYATLSLLKVDKELAGSIISKKVARFSALQFEDGTFKKQAIIGVADITYENAVKEVRRAKQGKAVVIVANPADPQLRRHVIRLKKRLEKIHPYSSYSFLFVDNTDFGAYATLSVLKVDKALAGRIISEGRFTPLEFHDGKFVGEAGLPRRPSGFIRLNRENLKQVKQEIKAGAYPVMVVVGKRAGCLSCTDFVDNLDVAQKGGKWDYRLVYINAADKSLARYLLKQLGLYRNYKKLGRRLPQAYVFKGKLKPKVPKGGMKAVRDDVDALAADIKAEEQKRLAEQERKAEEAKKIDEEKRRAEEARKSKEAEEKMKLEANRIAEEKRKAEEARRAREAEEKRKAEAARRAEEARKLADEIKSRAEDIREKTQKAKKWEQETLKAAEQTKRVAEEAKKLKETKEKGEKVEKSLVVAMGNAKESAKAAAEAEKAAEEAVKKTKEIDTLQEAKEAIERVEEKVAAAMEKAKVANEALAEAEKLAAILSEEVKKAKKEARKRKVIEEVELTSDNYRSKWINAMDIFVTRDFKDDDLWSQLYRIQEKGGWFKKRDLGDKDVFERVVVIDLSNHKGREVARMIGIPFPPPVMRFEEWLVNGKLKDGVFDGKMQSVGAEAVGEPKEIYRKLVDKYGEKVDGYGFNFVDERNAKDHFLTNKGEAIVVVADPETGKRYHMAPALMESLAEERRRLEVKRRYIWIPFPSLERVFRPQRRRTVQRQKFLKRKILRKLGIKGEGVWHIRHDGKKWHATRHKPAGFATVASAKEASHYIHKCTDRVLVVIGSWEGAGSAETQKLRSDLVKAQAASGLQIGGNGVDRLVFIPIGAMGRIYKDNPKVENEFIDVVKDKKSLPQVYLYAGSGSKRGAAKIKLSELPTTVKAVKLGTAIEKKKEADEEKSHHIRIDDSKILSRSPKDFMKELKSRLELLKKQKSPSSRFIVIYGQKKDKQVVKWLEDASLSPAEMGLDMYYLDTSKKSDFPHYHHPLTKDDEFNVDRGLLLCTYDSSEEEWKCKDFVFPTR